MQKHLAHAAFEGTDVGVPVTLLGLILAKLCTWTASQRIMYLLSKLTGIILVVKRRLELLGGGAH